MPISRVLSLTVASIMFMIGHQMERRTFIAPKLVLMSSSPVPWPIWPVILFPDSSPVIVRGKSVFVDPKLVFAFILPPMPASLIEP